MKKIQRIRMRNILAIVMVLTMLCPTVAKAEGENLETPSPSISYKTHVQSYGWQDYVMNGATSGTIGKAKRMEALQVRIDHSAYSGDIVYRTHVQSYGWQDWVSNDALSGTIGKSKRIEAVQMKLTGELAEHYDVYYRVHVQSYGWLGWAKNGKTAGTTGKAKRVEAIQMCLVEKGGNVPGTTVNSSHSAGNISYRTHVQTFGWQNYVSSGNVAGSTGLSKRLEGINIKVDTGEYGGGIRYSTHVQTYGWQDYVTDGAMSGTSGQGKRLEAIKIELTGEMAVYYDVYYRVHCQSYGWMEWKKNGEMAGTSGEARRLEAIQIFLCCKDEDVVYPKATATPMNGIRQLDPSKPMVALTYDDGPYGPYTNRILDSLQANGGKATFFVVGNRVASNASVVKRASDMGCQIANHTWSHPQLMSMSVAGVQTEINHCNSAVSSVTGKSPTMVRPVGGGVNAKVKSAVNYPMINWSVDTMDWKYRNADHVYHAVVDNVHDGDIVLMHDIHGTTAAASERIIPELTRRGYQLVTVEELAYYKGKKLTAHNVYNSCK